MSLIDLSTVSKMQVCRMSGPSLLRKTDPLAYTRVPGYEYSCPLVFQHSLTLVARGTYIFGSYSHSYQGAGLVLPSGNMNSGFSKKLSQSCLRFKVGHFCQMVGPILGALQITICKTISSFYLASFPGRKKLCSPVP